MKPAALFPVVLYGFYKYLKSKHPFLLNLLKNKLKLLPCKKIFFVCLILHALYIFLLKKGLLPKKSLINQHAFITGGGMGLGKKMALIMAS